MLAQEAHTKREHQHHQRQVKTRDRQHMRNTHALELPEHIIESRFALTQQQRRTHGARVVDEPLLTDPHARDRALSQRGTQREQAGMQRADQPAVLAQPRVPDLINHQRPDRPLLRRKHGPVRLARVHPPPRRRILSKQLDALPGFEGHIKRQKHPKRARRLHPPRTGRGLMHQNSVDAQLGTIGLIRPHGRVRKPRSSMLDPARVGHNPAHLDGHAAELRIDRSHTIVEAIRAMKIGPQHRPPRADQQHAQPDRTRAGPARADDPRRQHQPRERECVDRDRVDFK